MKRLKKVLALVLAITMIFSMDLVSLAATDSGTTSGGDFSYKIVHLDCGRKYFTKDWIKALLYEMKADGYNQLQLAFGNDGLRFLLDDMSFTANDTTYSNDAVVTAVKAGNKTQNSSGDESYLTQTEMDDIIATAEKLGIEIVPLLNLPGHANALLDIASDAYNYKTSSNTLDVANDKAVNFAMAIFQKYVDYFAGKECKFFNFGADEFANDIYSSSFAGMSDSEYSSFVTFINKLAKYIKDKGMTPRAFNDGLYYNYEKNASAEIDTAIQCCYWSSGWGTYKVASASQIAGKGHAMINTNGDYYYVLGKDDAFTTDQTTTHDANLYTAASGFSNTAFMGGNVSSPVGSMFCIWCDSPNAETETQVAANVRLTLRAMAARMNNEDVSSIDTTTVVANGFNADGSINTSSAEEKTTIQQDGKTVSSGLSLTKGASTALSLSDSSASAAWTSSDESVVTLTAASSNVSAASTTVNGSAVTVTAAGAGSATVTATLTDGTALTADVTVTDTSTIEADETIELTVGSTATRTQENVNNESNVDKTNLNENIAAVEVDGTDAVESKTNYTKVSAVSCSALLSKDTTTWTRAGSYYYKPDNDTNYYPLYAKRSSNWYGWLTLYTYTWGYLNASDEYEQIDTQETYRTSSDVGLTLYTASTTDPVAASTDITFTGVHAGETYVKVGDTTYKIVVAYNEETVQLYVNGASYTASNVTGSITAAPDSKVATAALSGGTLTITPVAEGDTTATVGDTIYTIKVSKEDLSNVDPLTVEYWITNSQITIDSSTYASVSAAADGVNSEDGIDATSIAPATTTKDNRTIEYWRCRLLDMTKGNSSTSGTERQTTEAGDDDTYNGVGFSKVRYWSGKWEVYTENSEWVEVKSTDQLVAYYMEVLDIKNSNGNSELHVNAADWGKKGDGSIYSNIYLEPNNSCTVSIQVVYEDSTTNPSDTTAANLDSKTFVYGYWTSGRGIGTMMLTGMEGYEIWKVSAETGSHTYKSNGSYDPYYVESFSWDNNEKTVWEDSKTPVESYTIHNSANSPSKDGYYENLMWDENHESILLRVYVKAKVTEDSLKVHYIDDTANNEFYTYGITVKDGTYFNEGFALENGALVNNTVENSNGATQTVQSDLSKMSEIGTQYRYSNYRCVKVERSEDGKEVYLHYTFKNTKSFVIDFGLSLVITKEDLGITGSGWEVSGAKYGDVDVDSTAGTLTYTPTTTLKGVEALTLTLTGDDNSTASYQIYIYPATSVYYEESFATLGQTTGFTVSGDAVNTTQTTSAEGSEDYYGYDAAYANDSTGASNGTQAVSDTSGDNTSFIFTGTGVDIYANTTTTSGTLYITVKNSKGTLVKMAQVDTHMQDGTGTLTKDQAKEAFNVPVASFDGLTRDTYTVKITHIKNVMSSTDKTAVTQVSLDGFRVYNTLDSTYTEGSETNSTSSSVYAKDKEENVAFYEARDLVLSVANLADYRGDYGKGENIISQVYDKIAVTADGAEATGAILNGNTAWKNATDATLKDLIDNGPKNEIYLQKDQTLVLNVKTIRALQVGLKALNAATSYQINNDNAQSLSTSTDMFYKLGNGTGNAETITITNKGDGILSVTLLKICDAPEDAIQPITEDTIATALQNIGVIEPEVTTADATANIKLVDYAENEIASTALTANGESGTEATFTADAIKAAADSVLPEGYGYANADAITDQTVIYGESGDVTVQVGKLATLTVTYKKLFGRTVGTATLTAVQTSSASQYTFSAAQIRNAVPNGYWTIKLAGKKVKFGSTGTLTVQVF